MDINLKPEERHRMFSERMTFWNMFQYKEMLEEYAVDNKEARMLIEIESAIDETEEGVESEIEDDEEDEEAGRHQVQQAPQEEERRQAGGEEEEKAGQEAPEDDGVEVDGEKMIRIKG